MPDYDQKYNFSGLYICGLIFVYNVWSQYGYEYIHIIFRQISIFNYTSLILIINIIGLYLLLKNIAFEVNIILSVKY